MSVIKRKGGRIYGSAVLKSIDVAVYRRKENAAQSLELDQKSPVDQLARGAQRQHLERCSAVLAGT